MVQHTTDTTELYLNMYSFVLLCDRSSDQLHAIHIIQVGRTLDRQAWLCHRFSRPRQAAQFLRSLFAFEGPCSSAQCASLAVFRATVGASTRGFPKRQVLSVLLARLKSFNMSWQHLTAKFFAIRITRKHALWIRKFNFGAELFHFFTFAVLPKQTSSIRDSADRGRSLLGYIGGMSVDSYISVFSKSFSHPIFFLSYVCMHSV